MKLGFLDADLSGSKENNLYRNLTPVSSENEPHLRIGKRNFINFSSNNYLGLANHALIKKSAIHAVKRWGAGSGASRLVSGDLEIHEALEKRLAYFKKEEAALIFSSGYLANLGAITALINEKDLILIDRFNHASLIDAARLSKAKLWVYPHNDHSRLNGLLKKAGSFRRKLVVTDAYFSMDGDIAPLDKISEICDKNDALLMIDEAHSSGVFGKRGSGLTEHFGLSGKIDVVMGTLSKAFGSVGGFVAGSNKLREYLINRSRPFIYTTAPSPSASAAAIQAIEMIEKKPALLRSLWKNINFFRDSLKELGFDLGNSEGPIVPVLVKNTVKTLKIKETLYREGIFAPAIRPPTVPKGTDRIRFSLMATHTQEDLNRCLTVLKKIKVQEL